jgi:hypothetical protein
MRKFVRIAIIVCLSVAAVPAAVLGFLWLWIWYQTAQVERFYQEHHLLNDMRAVQKQSTNDSSAAREVLLQILPLRADKDAAITVLRREGLGCKAIAEPIADTRLRQRFMEARDLASTGDDSRNRKEWVDCQVETPSLMGAGHWIVDLEFDADGHLSNARVAIWDIFL